ncbi:MAG: GNAT family N-acetyltransferase [Bacilli bacterium]
MICAHWQPPFSAVMKFGSWLQKHLPEGKTAEIRLFALRPEYRRGPLAIALAASLFAELEKSGLQMLVISGISVQQPFYQHIGFQVVGDPVSENGVTFFPMTGRLPDILKANPAWKKYQPQIIQPA